MIIKNRLSHNKGRYLIKQLIPFSASSSVDISQQKHYCRGSVSDRIFPVCYLLYMSLVFVLEGAEFDDQRYTCQGFGNDHRISYDHQKCSSRQSWQKRSVNTKSKPLFRRYGTSSSVDRIVISIPV